MRQLIKRALLYMARLALFFSVMAWVIGQWRLVYCEANIGFVSFLGSIAATGNRVGVFYAAVSRPEWNISVNVMMENARLEIDCLQIAPGVSFYWQVGEVWSITVHHWLCITITILSYCTVFRLCRRASGTA